jgi:hypothetical protein
MGSIISHKFDGFHLGVCPKWLKVIISLAILIAMKLLKLSFLILGSICSKTKRNFG